MSTIPTKIQHLINKGYEFRFGDYISKGFSLVTRNPGGFIGFMLLFGAIYVASIFIPIVGPLAFAVIAPALAIGPVHVAHRMDRGEIPPFSDFFRGFDKFGELFLTALLIGLITILAILPGYGLIIYGIFDNADVFNDPYMEPADVYQQIFSLFGTWPMMTGFLLVIVAATYLSVSFAWSNLFVWFYDMRSWDAMQASRKLIGKQFWIILAFIVVLALMAFMGLIVLLIGILFTYPVMFCAQYAAFADVTRLDREEDTDILDHFAPTEQL